MESFILDVFTQKTDEYYVTMQGDKIVGIEIRPKDKVV